MSRHRFIPADLADTLRADAEAEPAWRPVDDRIASGELTITLDTNGAKEPLPRSTTVRGLWKRIAAGWRS